MKKIIIPLLVCGLFACSKKDKDNPTTPQLEAVTEITAYLGKVDSLSEFEIAFKKLNISTADAAAGLTVFAPGNEAIGGYDIGARTMGKDLPDSIIKNHIVKGIFKAADLTDGKTLTTLSGKVLKVKVIAGVIYVNGVKITLKDGDAGDQVIHTIAAILAGSTGNADVTVFDAMQWSVNNRSGLPVAGATVKLYTSREKYNDGTEDYAVTTDANGIAHFTGIPVGEYLIVVTKGELSNIWPDVFKRTLKSTDSLYQSSEEVYNSAYLPGSQAGDFRFEDVNQDGTINIADAVDAPSRTISIGEGTATTQKVLIGYQSNHTMRPFATSEEAMLNLKSVAIQIGVQHKLLVMADGFMSDDVDCAAFPDWCTFDQFGFVSSNNTTGSIWYSMYASVQVLNKIILSLPTMTGDTTLLAAQTRGLRAYAYLELATYFGELPINTDLKMSQDIGRSTLANTFEFIKSELLIARATLPVNNITDGYRHMTVGAANALLARIAIMNNDFAGASTYAGAIMESSNYSLSQNASTVFDDVNGSEIIWDLSDAFPASFYQYFDGRSFCPVTRLSEIYLIYAEAKVAMGSVAEGGEYINLIRSRAGLETQVMNNPVDARNSLVEASKYTFPKEGHRFQNLVRWGLAAQVLSAKGYQSYHSKFPIPLSILDNYPNIYQNVGYN